MKYKALLHFLRLLIYIKRFFWWVGGLGYRILQKSFGRLWHGVVYVKYRVNFFLKKWGITAGGRWLWERGFLQIVVFLILFFLSLPHTKLYTKKDFGFPGQNTVAGALDGGAQYDYNDEVAIDATIPAVYPGSSWRDHGLSVDTFQSRGVLARNYKLSGIVAGGAAITKPIIIPGSTVVAIKRYEVEEYQIEYGDSLGSIAQDFGVSVATLLWENNLTTKSLIRPGQKIKIPPTTGVMHTVKKGDTLPKIAALYEGKVPEIISFNALKADGSNLRLGSRIMIPDGVAPKQKAVAKIRRTDTRVTRVAVPPASSGVPGESGFIWPTTARIITTYFRYGHRGIDIATAINKNSTPNYAAKSGTVKVAQCGYNNGYGCYIKIDHGGGVETLYGHNSKLLVSPGDYIERGQTIGIMGTTGKSTGIHLHFEIHMNGRPVNPLWYVK